MTDDLRLNVDFETTSLHDVPRKKVKKWYYQPFNYDWFRDDDLKDWIKTDIQNKYVVICTVCDIKLIHSNISSLLAHRNSQKHKNNLSAKSNNLSIQTFIEKPGEPEEHEMIAKAGLTLTTFMAEHHMPFLQADHLTETLKKMFPGYYGEIFR